MMIKSKLIEAVANLPGHAISGHEWECSSCHYHFDRRPGAWRKGSFVRDPGGKPPPCPICGVPQVRDEEIDTAGNQCDHVDLIDRKLVLQLLEDA
jgi:rubrerythrin